MNPSTGAIMELPQTWNKYSYEYNRPLYGTDRMAGAHRALEQLSVVCRGGDRPREAIRQQRLQLGYREKGAGKKSEQMLLAVLYRAQSQVQQVEHRLLSMLLQVTTGNIVGGAVTRSLDPNATDTPLLWVLFLRMHYQDLLEVELGTWRVSSFIFQMNPTLA